ncbi:MULTISPECIES: alpha,alpha-trehalase TreF [Haloarcula]|uniref:alpha,alpha-trehalase TreF n=1 Tax=Haloarcula TaxID=2237 RepID=UPI0023ED7941|nr:alpha,alpha-trehalase TreF [Halomicroarcula sp. XH51]
MTRPGTHTDGSAYPQLSGPLFEAVQRSSTFADSKTFVDSVPTTAPETIRERFAAAEDLDLGPFVAEHFDIPDRDPPTLETPTDTSMLAHIDDLWSFLDSPADDGRAHSTLLPLPRPYVRPGNRFREIYYWDTYFTAVGLAADGQTQRVRDMADNFAALVDRYGFVPNGNRCYYLGRSQPPVFCQYVKLLVEAEGTDAGLEYLPQLRREHEYWLSGTDALGPETPAHRRVVRLDDGVVANRYWDDHAGPRPESYREDVELAERVAPDRRESLSRDVRAAAESGWDFSSRWQADPGEMTSLRTTDLVPVDLNALLYDLEATLADWCRRTGDVAAADRYECLAGRRHHVLAEYCWDETAGFFLDYDFAAGERTDRRTLAAVVPLFVEVATDEQAAAVAATLREEFLQSGGLVTTLTETHQQWDWPQGWAPLQYMAVVGLCQYGYDDLAREIADRWLDLNRRVYWESGAMLEKYDVVAGRAAADVGEYDVQVGFGWTNGVALALSRTFEGSDETPLPGRARATN